MYYLIRVNLTNEDRLYFIQRSNSARNATYQAFSKSKYALNAYPIRGVNTKTRLDAEQQLTEWINAHELSV